MDSKGETKSSEFEHTSPYPDDSPKSTGQGLWSRNSLKLYLCLFVGYLVSAMTGYDGSLMGAINDMEQYQTSFGMNGKGSATGLVFVVYNLGSVAAFPFIGWLADGYGRRWAIFIGCVIVCIGTAIQTPANTMGQFQAGRFVLGFGVAIAGGAAPTYVVEISHPAHRGTQAGLYNTCWYLGSIVASWSCVGSNRHLHSSLAWRVPTALQAALPGIIALLVLLLPESPRWLIAQGRNEEAVAVLAKYHGEDDSKSPVVQTEYLEMQQQISSESGSSDKVWWDYRDLVNTRAARYRLGLVVCMAFFGQWSGNNVVSYYMPTMFAQTGIQSSDTRLVLNGIYPILCMFAAIWGATLLDQLGRRKMLIWATAACAVCFAVITTGTATSTDNMNAAYAVITFIYLFGAVFSWAYTPLQTLYSVEVLETKTRAKGTGLAYLFVNIAMCVNTFAAPIAMERIGWRYYLVFVGWNCIETLVIWKWFVETAGHTLEQLAEIFESSDPVKKSLEKRTGKEDQDA